MPCDVALSRVEIARRIAELPPDQRAAAVEAFRAAFRFRGAGAGDAPSRDIDQRRRYANDPLAAARDLYGYVLTKQQEHTCVVVWSEPRVLIPAAQNVGKSWLLALIALLRIDCTAALPDRFTGAEQQGARILLPGPDSNTIKQTIYAQMLVHAARAESRGYPMPGERSEQSVLWRVPGYPQWGVEAFSPPRRVGERQAHGAAGRHHANQHAFIEEGAGVSEALWRSVEGMCSGEGNTIVSAYNPTEPTSPARSREDSGGYVVVRLSALDHPNVRSRAVVVPGAVSHTRVDTLVRTDCTDRGPWPGTSVDAERGDFVYALPPAADAQDPAPHAAVPGHAAGQPRVYRPGPTAEVSILGRTASASVAGLFSAETISAAVARWRARTAPAGPPARVGVDPAREGSDDTLMAPAWGDAAEPLLLGWAAAQEATPEAQAAFLAKRRAYIGLLEQVAKGDGPDTARRIRSRWPASPFTIDDGGVGTSPIDHLRRVLNAQVGMVSFGGLAPVPTPGETWSENMRTAMYVRLARLLSFGLVDLPPDEQLREELLAHELETRSKSVEEHGRRVRVTSVLLCPKDKVKAKIGRSPDRADAVVLALTEAAGPRPARQREILLG